MSFMVKFNIDNKVKIQSNLKIQHCSFIGLFSFIGFTNYVNQIHFIKFSIIFQVFTNLVFIFINTKIDKGF